MHKNKPIIYLFTDGSVNPQSGIGFGGYLLLEELVFFATLENDVATLYHTNP